MMLSEIILYWLCRRFPGVETSRQVVAEDFLQTHALDRFQQAFGEASLHALRSKNIIDFGCGEGYQGCALALAGARSVVGIDILPSVLARAWQRAHRFGVTDRVSFADDMSISTTRCQTHWDVIFCQDAFEHFLDPAGILELWGGLLKPGGLVYLLFGPVWWSPYGAHLGFMTRLPWIQLLFSESTLLAVRQHYRADGARRFSEVKGGLNRMTVHRFMRLLKDSQFNVESLELVPVRKLKLLIHVPGGRELFTSEIRCVLSKSPRASRTARGLPMRESSVPPR